MIAQYLLEKKQQELRKKQIEFEELYKELMHMSTEHAAWDMTVKKYQQAYSAMSLLETEIDRIRCPKPYKQPGNEPDTQYYLPIQK